MTGFENNDYWLTPLIHEEFFGWHYISNKSRLQNFTMASEVTSQPVTFDPAHVITIEFWCKTVPKVYNIKVFCSCSILYVATCNLGKVKLQANVVSSSVCDLWRDSRSLCLSWLMLHLMLALWADLCQYGPGCSKQGWVNPGLVGKFDSGKLKM